MPVSITNLIRLFDTLIGKKPKCLITSIVSIPETIATLNRKKNEGKIGSLQLKEILANLFNEVDLITIKRLIEI